MDSSFDSKSELAVFGYIKDIEHKLFSNIPYDMHKIKMLCLHYFADALVESVVPDISDYEHIPSRPRSSSRSIHVHYGAAYSQIISLEVNDDDSINYLYDNIMDSAQKSIPYSNASGLAKIYEDVNGKNEIEDLGDLIEVIDEKKTADIIHLYFSNKEEKQDNDIPSNTPSMIKQWSMQTTPRQSVAPIFTFNDDDNDDCNDSDKENSATISFSPSSSMRTPLVSSPDTDIYRNSDSSEMVKYGYKIIKLIDDTLRFVLVLCIYTYL